MRILVLSYYYPPDIGPGSLRAKSIVDALLDEGPSNLKIDVITTKPNRYHSLKILNLYDAIEQVDLICLLVKHREFLEPEVKQKLMKSQVLDFCGALS